MSVINYVPLVKLVKKNESSFKQRLFQSFKKTLNLLHMGLSGVPMRVASINGKRYILVIVDDYSRYTWTLFLRSKDETPEVLKDFLTMIQRNLQALVIYVRTDRGTEFLKTQRKKKKNTLMRSDGENLDKMKEKGDSCILVDTPLSQRDINPTTREQGLVPQRQKASDYDNPDPAPEQKMFSP
ncbi:retrovirus-related pol polyprotein from transposon TNT 1-94 [Tanacetum coccineum]|uniref:Retrovirus-related pol polyprotein from transposon TNT 1-94 n=1 Tax=Tanacetum coccineum TaxID=301880 RepID=A0ABQ4WZ44_9ASTR